MPKDINLIMNRESIETILDCMATRRWKVNRIIEAEKELSDQISEQRIRMYTDELEKIGFVEAYLRGKINDLSEEEEQK